MRPRVTGSWCRAAGACALVWLLGCAPRHESRPAASTPDPAAHLDPETSYQAAVELAGDGRNSESLPFFRRALAGPRQSDWLTHYNYGGVLYNVVLEIHAPFGLPMQISRSSWERVALMKESLAEFEIAERLAPTDADRATVRIARGNRLLIWGLLWDAHVEFVAADSLDPGRPEVRAILEASKAPPEAESGEPGR